MDRIEDTDVNIMRYEVRKERKQVRFDRILIKSSQWKPVYIELLGNTPIAGTDNVFPSDHFGLFAKFELK